MHSKLVHGVARRLKASLLVCLCALASVPPAASSARDGIEKIMRAFQERHYAARGSYLTGFPDRADGTPAPSLPPDGFYGPGLTDVLHAEIIRKMFGKLFIGSDTPARHYVSEPNLQGRTSREVYDLTVQERGRPVFDPLIARIYLDAVSQERMVVERLIACRHLLKSARFADLEEKTPSISGERRSGSIAENIPAIQALWASRPWVDDDLNQIPSVKDAVYLENGSGPDLLFFVSDSRVRYGADLTRARGRARMFFTMFPLTTDGGVSDSDVTAFLQQRLRASLPVPGGFQPDNTYYPLNMPVAAGTNWQSEWFHAGTPFSGGRSSPGSISFGWQWGNYTERTFPRDLPDANRIQWIVVTCDFKERLTPQGGDLKSLVEEKDAPSICDIPPGSVGLHHDDETHEPVVFVSLGADAFGAYRGGLEFAPTQALDGAESVENWTASAQHGFSAVRDAAGSLRQAVGPATLAVFENPDADDGEQVVVVYERDPGSEPGTDGLYPVPATPAVSTVTIEEAPVAQSSSSLMAASANAAAAVTPARLRVTREAGGESDAWELEYDAASDQWTRIGSKDATVRRVQRIATEDPLVRQELETVEDDAGNVLSRRMTTRKRFPWGEEIIEERVGEEGDEAVTDFEYYEDEGSGSFRKLKLIDPDTAPWVRFTYDGYGRIAKRVTQFLNTAPTAPESECRVTTFTYSSGVQATSLETTVVETLLGQEVARRYIRRGFDSEETIVCRQPGAGIDDAGNLTSHTRYLKSGPLAGRMESVTSPDGTLALYEYQLDGNTLDDSAFLTTIVSTGAANGSGDAVADGTRTVTVTSREGYVISESSEDIQSGQEIAARHATATDASGRPTEWSHLGGTTTSLTYGCCGLESKTDRLGIVTSYGHAPASMSERRLGIAHTTLRSSRTVVRRRTGSDGATTTVSTTAYDLRGRPVSATAANGASAAFSESADGEGNRVRTTAYPDGGTRIETYAGDGLILSVTGTAVQPREFEYGVDGDGEYLIEHVLDAGGNRLRWSKSSKDMLGNVWKVARSDGAGATTFFDAAGRASKSVDPDGVARLFEYDARGRLETTAVDADGNGAIDLAGNDKITRQSVTVGTKNGKTVVRTAAAACVQPGDPALTEISLVEESVDGLDTWTTANGLTTHSYTRLIGIGAWTTTTESPDGTRAVETHANGRLSSRLVTAAGGEVLESLTYRYDALGRVESIDDARTGATTFTYHPDDSTATVALPPPAGGGAPQTTGYQYDPMGRLDIESLPGGGQVDYDYFPTGQLRRKSGAFTYPVDFTYNPDGQLTTLATATGTTTWTYDAGTGFLVEKTHADGKGVRYSHTPGGRVNTRTWQRGVVTTYGYDNLGRQDSVAYSDGTPPVTYEYDRLGQVTRASSAAGVHAYDVNPFGELVSDSVTGGIADGVSITPGYDPLRRVESLQFSTGHGDPIGRSYAYDAASRLGSLASGNLAATYTYAPVSDLVGAVEVSHDGAPRLSTANTWDNLNRLAATQADSTGASPHQAGFTYRHNDDNQRTRTTRHDGSYWEFDYDLLGQMTSAGKKTGAGVDVPGRRFEFDYDASGNRTAARQGSAGALRETTYQPNNLNQQASRTHPPVIAVTGKADPAADVNVNGQPAARQGEYFHLEIPADNAQPEATGRTIEIQATLNGQTDTIQHEAIATPATETCAYDDDGNLISDGLWEYAWDAENRLVRVQTRDASPIGFAPVRVGFDYDHEHRRVRKRVYGKINGAWTLAREIRFVYDGWNLLAETEPSGRPIRSYLWGLDVSGSRGGAGGVGGLIAIHDHRSGQSHLAVHDGNGNLIALVDAESGAPTAEYEYDPFGNPTTTSGPYAHRNPIRFSNKYRDQETGHYYYGHRHYDPAHGRWLNRDPLGEEGGVNLYAFVGNDGVNRVDPLGLREQFIWLNYRTPEGRVVYGPVPKVRSKRPEGMGEAFLQGLGNVRQAVTDPYKMAWEAGDYWGEFFSDAIRDQEAFGAELRRIGSGFENLGSLGERFVDDPCFRQRAIRLAKDEVRKAVKTPDFWSKASADIGIGALFGSGSMQILKRLKLLKKLEKVVPDEATTAANPAPASMPNRFDGVRQASQYLQDLGVPRADRVRILQSFEVDAMRVKTAGKREFGLRYFSDPDRAGGSYLFETFPASRGSLAIKPEWSKMSGFRQFQVRPGATVLEGPAAPQGPLLPGGQTQKFILDWRSDLITP